MEETRVTKNGVCYSYSSDDDDENFEPKFDPDSLTEAATYQGGIFAVDIPKIIKIETEETLIAPEREAQEDCSPKKIAKLQTPSDSTKEASPAKKKSPEKIIQQQSPVKNAKIKSTIRYALVDKVPSSPLVAEEGESIVYSVEVDIPILEESTSQKSPIPLIQLDEPANDNPTPVVIQLEEPVNENPAPDIFRAKCNCKCTCGQSQSVSTSQELPIISPSRNTKVVTNDLPLKISVPDESLTEAQKLLYAVKDPASCLLKITKVAAMLAKEQEDEMKGHDVMSDYRSIGVQTNIDCNNTMKDNDMIYADAATQCRRQKFQNMSTQTP